MGDPWVLHPDPATQAGFYRYRLQIHIMSDMMASRMAVPHVSVFFHDAASYACPDCKADTVRANRHGWFWWCEACQKHYPLYSVQAPKPIFEPTKEKTLLEKVRGIFHG